MARGKVPEEWKEDEDEKAECPFCFVEYVPQVGEPKVCPGCGCVDPGEPEADKVIPREI